MLGRDATMSDRRTLAASLAAAVVIVGGGIYAVLKQASPIVGTTPSPAVAAPGAVTPPAARATSTGPAIYRCKVRGSITYSDTPCEGAKVVDVQPTRGFEMPKGSSQRAPVAVAKAPSATPTVASSSDASSSTECRYLDEQIANIDAAARAGGTAPYMDELRDRRRKLVDRKYELHC